MEISESPRYYGVPHNEWRPSQLDAFRFAMETKEEGKQFLFLELPTGVGKSGISTAFGKNDKVLVCVHTLGLLEQYYEEYGFSIVKGRQEYPCVYPAQISAFKKSGMGENPTAADCPFNKMSECSYIEECPYHITKLKAIKAQRSACTYRYAALSKAMQDRKGIIVFDEGHSIVDELIAFGEFEVKENVRTKWGLSKFPFIDEHYGENGNGGILTNEAIARVASWFDESIELVKKRMSGIPGDPMDLSAKKFSTRLTGALDNMLTAPYFFEVGKDIGWEKKRGRSGYSKAPAMRLKCLDASGVAYRIYQKKDFAVFMSATIGDPKPIATELGIEKAEYNFRTYDHPLNKNLRPIVNPKFAKMSNVNLTNNPGLYKKQAKIIKRFINKMPKHWKGLILTSSYKKITELQNYMLEWMPERVFDPEKKWRGAERIAMFKSLSTDGQFLIDTIQGLGTGINLAGETARWIVVAGVPFQNPYDPYVCARRKKPGGGNFYNYSAYNAIPQACGRVARGMINENTKEPYLNIAFLADGIATSKNAMKYYPKWLNEAFCTLDEAIEMIEENE